MFIFSIFQAVLRCDFPRRPRSQQGQQQADPEGVEQQMALAAPLGSANGQSDDRINSVQGPAGGSGSDAAPLRVSASSSSVESGADSNADGENSDTGPEGSASQVRKHTHFKT